MTTTMAMASHRRQGRGGLRERERVAVDRTSGTAATSCSLWVGGYLEGEGPELLVSEEAEVGVELQNLGVGVRVVHRAARGQTCRQIDTAQAGRQTR